MKIIVEFKITVITQGRAKEIPVVFYNDSDYDYHFYNQRASIIVQRTI